MQDDKLTNVQEIFVAVRQDPVCLKCGGKKILEKNLVILATVPLPGFIPAM